MVATVAPQKLRFCPLSPRRQAQTRFSPRSYAVPNCGGLRRLVLGLALLPVDDDRVFQMGAHLAKLFVAPLRRQRAQVGGDFRQVRFKKNVHDQPPFQPRARPVRASRRRLTAQTAPVRLAACSSTISDTPMMSESFHAWMTSYTTIGPT